MSEPSFVVHLDAQCNHLVNTCQKCPKCGGTDFEVRRYDLMWHEGEVWCVPCNVYVRQYDAG
jgi:hypothetical protein